jgi:alkylhydroperoxidase family enzyme
VESVLADRRTAPTSARFQAVLDLLEKLTLTPEEVGPADVKAARGQGVSDAALRQAIYVCFVMSTMDRIADALAFELPDAQILKRYAWIATTFGYKKLSLPG